MCFQEAVQRYTDTSLQIFNCNHQRKANENVKATNENGHLTNSSCSDSDETQIEQNQQSKIETNGHVEPIRQPHVQIETIEVTYEPVKTKVEVVLVRKEVSES